MYKYISISKINYFVVKKQNDPRARLFVKFSKIAFHIEDF